MYILFSTDEKTEECTHVIKRSVGMYLYIYIVYTCKIYLRIYYIYTHTLLKH